MWSLDLTNKQIILNWYDSFIPILALLAFFWLFYLKNKFKFMYGFILQSSFITSISDFFKLCFRPCFCLRWLCNVRCIVHSVLLLLFLSSYFTSQYHCAQCKISVWSGFFSALQAVFQIFIKDCSEVGNMYTK